jgi:hypothetical protein
MSALLRALALSALSALACSDLATAPGRTGPGDADGGGGDDTPDPDAQPSDQFDTALEMITAFGNCMSYDDWVNQQLTQLPLQDTDEIGAPRGSGDGDLCVSCHTMQGTGAYLGEDPVRTYDHHREVPSIYKMALPLLDPTSGEPVEVIPNDRYVAKGEGGNGHPTYILDPAVEEGLDRFFELTYARFTAQEGDCTPDDPQSL